MAPAMPECPIKPSPSLRCRRSAAAPGTVPVCSRRNERERQRVRQVNLGFQALRQHVPTRGGAGTPRRLSKVQTLQAALNYIRGLQELLLRGAEGSPESGVEEGVSSPDTGAEEEREAEEAAWFYSY